MCLTFTFIAYNVLALSWKVFKSALSFKTSLLLILKVLSNATNLQPAVNFSPTTHKHTHMQSLILAVPILWLFKIVVL